jgi:hypothetical protein
MAKEGGWVFWLQKDYDNDGKEKPVFGQISAGAQPGTPLIISSEQDMKDYYNTPENIGYVDLLTKVEEKLTAELARVAELKSKAVLKRNAEAANGGGKTRKNITKRKKNTRHRR